MIEIIPNWHPMIVHFTVALVSTSVGLYILIYVIEHLPIAVREVLYELKIAARWSLWLGALVTLGTVVAGFYAYYTVRHDAISHAAMTNHRNWAVTTSIAIFLMATWSFYQYIKHKKETFIFVMGLLIMQGLLLSTAWKGGELVYRYGLGVISLPQPEEIGHRHP